LARAGYDVLRWTSTVAEGSDTGRRGEKSRFAVIAQFVDHCTATGWREPREAYAGEAAIKQAISFPTTALGRFVQVEA
jgi:hypothetical protein